MRPLDEIRATYFAERDRLTSDPQLILDHEKRVTDLLADIVENAVERIAQAIDDIDLNSPFWVHYKPAQRGNKPTGNNTPWAEGIEKETIAVLAQEISKHASYGGQFGLPFGGDTRFVIDQAVDHLDVKASGRTESKIHEVVAEQNQLSGDGIDFDETGVRNSRVRAKLPRRTVMRQPRLSPLYIHPRSGEPLLTTTHFVRVCYDEIDGRQPITGITLVSVPNGLLLWQPGRYPKLLGAGKDAKKVNALDRRLRIKYPHYPDDERSWRVREYSV